MPGIFITPPTIFERQFYKDYFWAYTPVPASNSDTSGYVIATNTTSGVPLAGIAFNFHATQNFDAPRSPAGQDKLTNELTSDVLTTQPVVNLSAKYIIYFITRWGRTGWRSISGSAQDETLNPCTAVLLVPIGPLPGITPPTI